MSNDKTIWGASQFADLALRLKNVEARIKETDQLWQALPPVASIGPRLDKLERPWAETREQRQREIAAVEALDGVARMQEVNARYTAATAYLAEKRAHIVLEPKGHPRAQTAGAGDNRTIALNANIADLLEEIVRLEQSRNELMANVNLRSDKIEELRVHIRAQLLELEDLRRQNTDLQEANNRYLERARAAEASLQDRADNSEG
jgi:chromosome segregation ATPase